MSCTSSGHNPRTYQIFLYAVLAALLYLSIIIQVKLKDSLVEKDYYFGESKEEPKYVDKQQWLQKTNSYELALEWSIKWSFIYKNTIPNTKVLFLTDITQVFFCAIIFKNIQTDRSFSAWIDGAKNHPNLEITVWGPGFDKWDPNLDSTTNIQNQYKCNHFNLIVLHPMSPNVPKLCGDKSLIYFEFGDCNNGECIKQYNEIPQIMSFRHGFVPLELFDVRFPLFDEIKPAAQYVHAKVFTHNP